MNYLSWVTEATARSKRRVCNTASSYKDLFAHFSSFLLNCYLKGDITLYSYKAQSKAIYFSGWNSDLGSVGPLKFKLLHSSDAFKYLIWRACLTSHTRSAKPPKKYSFYSLMYMFILCRVKILDEANFQHLSKQDHID